MKKRTHTEVVSELLLLHSWWPTELLVSGSAGDGCRGWTQTHWPSPSSAYTPGQSAGGALTPSTEGDKKNFIHFVNSLGIRWRSRVGALEASDPGQRVSDCRNWEVRQRGLVAVQQRLPSREQPQQSLRTTNIPTVKTSLILQTWRTFFCGRERTSIFKGGKLLRVQRIEKMNKKLRGAKEQNFSKVLTG